MAKSITWVIILVGVVFVSCSTQQPAIITEDAVFVSYATQQPTATPPDFENGTYQLLGSFNPNPVTLSDGIFETQTDLGRESLSYITHALGELDVAILAQYGGGSGTFYRLGVYNNVDGILVEWAFTWLGDRVIVHFLGVQDGQIVVVVTKHGAEDPLCCPTKVVIQRYVDENGELTLISEEMIGNIVGP
jgi:hypothetical protein